MLNNLIFPLLYIVMHTKLKRGSYYHFVAKVENGKKMFGSTLLAGIIVLVFTLVNINGTDVSRLVKQWNREYIVQRYGIVIYAIYLVSLGKMEIGTVLLIYSYYAKIITNFEVLGTINAEFQSVKVSINRLNKIKSNQRI